MKLRFTAAEWAIIEHRLTLDDCLADVLSDTYDWDWEETREKVSNFYRRLRSFFQAHGEVEFEVNDLTEVEREALIDCVDGSTWFASSENAVASGEISWGRLMAQRQCAERIEKKMEAAGLKTTGFPMA